jgi:hypothetical protein
MMPESADDLDSYDRKILALLSGEGASTITELARRIGLSKTPCQARVRKLEASGHIKGYRAVLDPGKLGLGHVTFVEVRLSDTRESALKGVQRGGAGRAGDRTMPHDRRGVRLPPEGAQPRHRRLSPRVLGRSSRPCPMSPAPRPMSRWRRSRTCPTLPEARTPDTGKFCGTCRRLQARYLLFRAKVTTIYWGTLDPGTILRKIGL